MITSCPWKRRRPDRKWFFLHKLGVEEFFPHSFNISKVVENEAITTEKVKWQELQAAENWAKFLCSKIIERKITE